MATTPISIEQQLDITRDCIYAKVSAHAMGSCCCEDCKNATFWKHRYFNLVGKAISCDTVFDVLTTENILQMISTTGCKGCIDVPVLPNPAPKELVEQCLYLLPDPNSEAIVSISIDGGATMSAPISQINLLMGQVNMVLPNIVVFELDTVSMLYLYVKKYESGHTVLINMDWFDYGNTCGVMALDGEPVSGKTVVSFNFNIPYTTIDYILINNVQVPISGYNDIATLMALAMPDTTWVNPNTLNGDWLVAVCDSDVVANTIQIVSFDGGSTVIAPYYKTFETI